MRGPWAILLVLLTAISPWRPIAEVCASHEAQIYAASAPDAPYEPRSPDRTDIVSIGVVAIVHARAFFAPPSPATAVSRASGIGPGRTDDGRVERPPITPSFPS